MTNETHETRDQIGGKITIDFGAAAENGDVPVLPCWLLYTPIQPFGILLPLLRSGLCLIS